MKLYHISFSEIKSFFPRVPEYRCEGEDAEIPRICFSDDMYLALKASPSCGNIIKGAFDLGFHPTLYVYEVDTDSLDQEVWMHYTQVSKYVPDAESTHECWVTVPLNCFQCKCRKYVVRDAILKPVVLNEEINFLFVYGVCWKGCNAKSNERKFLESVTFPKQYYKLRNKMQKLFAESVPIYQFLTWWGRGELSFLADELTLKKEPVNYRILDKKEVRN